MNTSPSIPIGTLARRAGCSVPTIRYYEEIGLLPAAARSEAGRRVYGEAAVRRLAFVRRCRDFGFSIEQVRELAALIDHPERPCAEARDVAAVHLQQVRERLAELRVLEAGIAAFVERCDTDCAGGVVGDCTILEDLGIGAARPDRAACRAPREASQGEPT
jgi:DNA-binding transcriptional MerR regulator